MAKRFLIYIIGIKLLSMFESKIFKTKYPMMQRKIGQLLAILLFLNFFIGCNNDDQPVATVSDSFESGNIGEVVSLGNNEWELFLADDNDNPELPDSWRSWWYVKMENLLPGVPTEITLKNSGWPYYYVPVYSYNQTDWFHFSETEVTQNDSSEVVVCKQFEQKSVWIARFYPYTFTDLENYLKTIKGNPNVYIQVPGYSQEGRSIYLLKITNPDVPNASKERVFIHARTHSAEVPPSFLIEGMVNFLLSGTTDAADILSRFEFYIFPMQNVDGVVAGNYRSTPKSENLEMLWVGDSNNPLNLVAATPPEVAIIQKYAVKLMNDGGPAISMALNLHASNSEPDICPFFFPHFGPETEGYSATEASLWNKQLNFINHVANHYGEKMIEPITGAGGGSFATKTYPESWWWVNYADHVMAMTFEMTYGRSGYSPRWIDPNDLRGLGKSLAFAIRDYYDEPIISSATMLKSKPINRFATLKYPDLYPPKAADEMKE